MDHGMSLSFNDGSEGGHPCSQLFGLLDGAQSCRLVEVRSPSACHNCLFEGCTSESFDRLSHISRRSGLPGGRRQMCYRRLYAEPNLETASFGSMYSREGFVMGCPPTI